MELDLVISPADEMEHPIGGQESQISGAVGGNGLPLTHRTAKDLLCHIGAAEIACAHSIA